MYKTGMALISRLALIGLAAAIAVAGLLCLTGCDSSDVKGKTLYYYTTYGSSSSDIGKQETITFDKEDGWVFSNGESSYGGTWSREDDTITLMFSTGAVRQLQKLDGEDGFALVGYESVGERYYFSEEDAQAWHDQFLQDAPSMVSGLLESVSWNWSSALSSGALTTQQTIAFKDGICTYTKGEYDQTQENLYGSWWHNGPSYDSWLGQDHSGSYTLTVDKINVSTLNGSVYYNGVIDVGGEQQGYALTISSDGMKLGFGDYVEENNSFSGGVITYDVSFTSESA